MRRITTAVLFGGLFATTLAMVTSAQAPTAPTGAPPAINFSTDIKPVLEKSCWKCHSADLQLSGLDLSTRESAVKGGDNGPQVIGSSDEWGYKALEQPISFHDLHATILYLLGVEHTKLTYRYNGRDMRLTDVYGEVIPQLANT